MKTTLIGKRIPKLDAPEKARALTRYIQDLDLPGMLYGKILFAGRPHARIISIDTSAARGAARRARRDHRRGHPEHVPFGVGQGPHCR